jgi:hypothetical protein
MRALTIKQPWASMIAAGHKTIENRSWRPPAGLVGQRIAIHAGAGWDEQGARWIRGTLGIDVRRDELPASRVLCTAVIDRVIEASDDPWWRGPLGWVLRDVQAMEGPVCKGRLSLWHLEKQATSMSRRR